MGLITLDFDVIQQFNIRLPQFPQIPRELTPSTSGMVLR